MNARRGQALVEFALILPLLLFVILGGIQVGLAMTVRYELVVAAAEGADTGALDRTPETRCSTALAATAAVYGHPLASSDCRLPTGLVEVTAAVDLPLVFPLFGASWHISVTQRAEIR